MVAYLSRSAQTPFVLPDAVIGAIGLWSGSLVTIPSGWSLCDGTNGTPNLTDKFVVGAGDTYPVAGTGGAFDHTHPFTVDDHKHPLHAGPDLSAGPSFLAETSTDPSTGTTDASSGPLPFYSLAYIMFTGV